MNTKEYLEQEQAWIELVGLKACDRVKVISTPVMDTGKPLISDSAWVESFAHRWVPQIGMQGRVCSWDTDTGGIDVLFSLFSGCFRTWLPYWCLLKIDD